MNTVNPLAVLTGFWRHLPARRRRQLPALAVLMMLGGLMETISLGAIVPFLGALAAPEKIFESKLGALAGSWFGVATAGELVAPLALVFGAAAIASAGLRLLILWLNTRLSYAIGAEISVEGYRRTLFQPYSVHVSRNSSVVISGIDKKTRIAIAVLYQLLMLASSLVMTAAVIAALIFIDPKMALTTGVVFGAFYLIITKYSRRELLDNSRTTAEQENHAIKVLQEGLGGVRDVLLDGAQAVYSKQYQNVNDVLRAAQSRNVFLSNFPRYALEAFGMLVVAVWAYWAASSGGASRFGSALPVLGAFGLGAQRLLPALQQIYSGWASVVGNNQALRDVVEMLDQPLPEFRGDMHPAPMKFEKSLKLDGVRFRYGTLEKWVLDGATLEIPKGMRIGLAGSTGTGKSTVVDLVLGLLPPLEGRVLVDGVEITAKNLRSWQGCIAHVPQNIFLSDASVAENIAFGVPADKIDLAKVKKAAADARIAEFIESRPDGYDTFVGERGIRLSGGQRQRIGIARALYKGAPVLVLDEATSSLDNETEDLVMQTIDGLNRDLTILIVAHRLTTLKACDRVIELSGGKAVLHPSYETFMAAR